MRAHAQILAVAAAVVFLSVTAATGLTAQVGDASLSGTIKGPTGTGVATAKVTAKNVATGQTTGAYTDSMGQFSFTGLATGDYEVTVTAEGFDTKTTKVTLGAGAQQKLDLSLAPASGGGELSLSDLGFPTAATKGSAADQARLDKRSHMLKVHQELGLIAAAPMVASIFTSFNAKGHHGAPGSASGRNVHAILGLATTDLYFTSAYFAIRAPKIPSTQVRGPIRVHKALAWVHGTGMILTPILGAIAYSQENRGERVHGIAKAHGAVATVTYASYGAAILAVSIKF